MIGTIGEPFLHSEKVHQRIPILACLNERQVVLSQRAERRHQRKHRAPYFSRYFAHGLDQQVDVSRSEPPRPHVHEPRLNPLVSLISVKIDWSNDGYQIADTIRMKRRVAQR